MTETKFGFAFVGVERWPGQRQIAGDVDDVDRHRRLRGGDRSESTVAQRGETDGAESRGGERAAGHSHNDSSFFRFR
jgi:hypothetical protein